jgi:hypothetical protein
MARALSGVLALVLATLPAIAGACPACGARDNDPGRWVMIAGMVTLPFAVAGGSIAIIKRMMRAESNRDCSNEAQTSETR